MKRSRREADYQAPCCGTGIQIPCAVSIGISPVGKEAFIYEFDPAGGADSFKKGLALDGGGYMQVQLIAPNPTK